MLRYVETFFRHRLLLIAPVVLAIAVSLGWTLSQPRMYEADAKVWYDATPLAGSNSLNPYIAPADAQAASLKELVQTRSFDNAVGHRGPLADYIQRMGSGSFSDPLALLLGKISGQTPSIDSAGMDRLIQTTLNAKVVVAPVGPQILSITFDAPDPIVAAGTVQAIVDQFFSETLAGRRAAAQTAADFYGKELNAQPKPSATDTLGQQAYDSLVQKLSDARLQLAAQDQPAASGFRLLDSPVVPDQPKGFRKAALFAGLGGLTVGLTIMLAALMLLTWTDETSRARRELESMFGRRVVGSVPRAR